MNTNITSDSFLPSDARRTEQEPNDTERTEAGMIPAKACELFEGGLGI